MTVVYTDEVGIASCNVKSYFDAEFFPKTLELHPINDLVSADANRIKLVLFFPTPRVKARLDELKSRGYHLEKTISFMGSYPGQILTYARD